MAVATSGRRPSERLTAALLLCGAISSLLYIATDIIAAMWWRGYSYTAQQVSELSAIGAPTRAGWVAMSSVYAPLVVAFGVGVWLAADSKRSLRLEGILFVAFGIVAIMWVLVAPMHLRGTAFTATDSAHLVFAAVQLVIMLTFITIGALAIGGGFRIYSIATVVAMLAAGGVVSTAVRSIAEGQPTPWMGLVERVSVYAPIVWVFVFALVLLSRVRERAASTAVGV